MRARVFIKADWARTCANVEPVRVIGRELLVRAGLDDVDPCRDLKLAGPLQVRGVRLDERIGTVGDDGQHESNEQTAAPRTSLTTHPTSRTPGMLFSYRGVLRMRESDGAGGRGVLWMERKRRSGIRVHGFPRHVSQLQQRKF